MAKACTAAAKELTAARKLIAGYEDNIIAANDRIELAKREIETLSKINALSAERAKELEAVITAERTAKAALLELKEIQEKRIAKLDKSLKRSRKLTLIMGTAAGVAVLVSVAK